MISIKNVNKWYGDFQVLTDCSTEVKKGEVIGELGGRLVGDNDESLGNHYIASIPKCAWIKAGRRSASSLRYGPGLRVSICAPIRARGHTPPRSLSANESAPFGASP